MSNPKEKAKELVRQFYSIGANECKQCALIAVDEIIKSNPCYEDSDRGGNFMWNDNTYYWQEVKQEINNL